MSTSATGAIESPTGGSRWHAGRKVQLAGYFAYALLMLLAVGHFLTAEWQVQMGHDFITSAREALATGTASGLAEAVLFGVAIAFWYLAKGLVIFLAFFLVEWALVGRPKNWSILAFAMMLRVLAILVITPILNRVIPVTTFQPLLLLEKSHFPSFLMPIAGVGLALATLLFLDLVAYLAHRLQHAIPLLWRFHSVHHSLEDIDSTNSYSHPVDSIVERLVLIAFSSLIGFKADLIIVLVAFSLLHDRLLHTSAPLNLGKLNLVVMDNRSHNLHHSNRPEHYDKNFGSHLTLWDRVFGTYIHPHPTERLATGLVEKLPPTTFRQYIFAALKDRDGEGSTALTPADTKR